MPKFIAQPAFEIGRRLEIRGLDSFAWFVIVCVGDDGSVLESFAIELQATLEAQIRVISLQGLSPDQVREALLGPPDDVLILTGLESYVQSDWRALDVNRSRLVRSGPIVLWLSFAGLTQLCKHAPNLRSFIGGSIFTLSHSGEAMTERERLERISELESHYNRTSEELIQQATTRELPPEPEFVEWLVLLGRGDLV